MSSFIGLEYSPTGPPANRMKPEPNHKPMPMDDPRVIIVTCLVLSVRRSPVSAPQSCTKPSSRGDVFLSGVLEALLESVPAWSVRSLPLHLASISMVLHEDQVPFAQEECDLPSRRKLQDFIVFIFGGRQGSRGRWDICGCDSVFISHRHCRK